MDFSKVEIIQLDNGLYKLQLKNQNLPKSLSWRYINSVKRLEKRYPRIKPIKYSCCFVSEQTRVRNLIGFCM